MRNNLFLLSFILLLQVNGILSGQFFSASLTSGGGSDVCLGDSLKANISFAGGIAPYTVVINDNSGEYKVLEDINSPHTVYLKPGTDNTYYLASAVDSKGTTGTVYGTVSVAVNPSTPVSFAMDRTAFLQTESGVSLVSLPTGGSFSGPGVAGSTFYPAIATSLNSPHLITCTLTNEYGCQSTDEIDLYVLSGKASVYLVYGEDTISTICDDGASYYLKGSNDDHIPGTFELFRSGSSGPIAGHIIDSDTSDNEAILDASGLSGVYEIIYRYGVDLVEISASANFEVNDLDSLKISNLPSEVCKSNEPYVLVPNLFVNDPGAIFSFTGPGVSGNQTDGYIYDPASEDAPLGDNRITLDYSSSNGCRATISDVVYNSFAPSLDFSISAACVSDEGGTISFNNMTSGKYSVATWNWDFGDPESGSENTSELEHPEHFFSEAGYREITLTAITNEGCVTVLTKDTVFADQPVADFTWLNDCFIRGERTQVLSRSVSSFAEIDTLIWTFKTVDGGVLGVIGSGSPSDTIEFPFTSMDQYVIELYIENEVECSGNISKEFSLEPTIKLPVSGYRENFNGGTNAWTIDSNDDLESWVLSEPDFTGFEQIEGDLAWFTKLPDHTTGYLEQSWIQSPCFDISGFEKPVIQMDLMKSFLPGIDGAVLQYQDLVSEGWKTLGTIGEGLNWYNSRKIYNEPGGSSIAWGLELFQPDREWVSAGHSLDILAGSTHVKFRMIVATGGSQEITYGIYNQGFAFDNIFIGDRIRRSILEHFTNSSSNTAYIADGVIDTFSRSHSKILFDLQYHMDYPGEDAMNLNNPYAPSARAFNYGVPGVPYAVLNGGIGPENRFDFSDPSQEPNDDALREASLEIPLFNMALSLDYQENRLEGTVITTCLADTFTSNLQLYVVIIEREVTAYTGMNQDTSFHNVVLDILPSPAGKLLGNEWGLDTERSLNFSWDYPAYVEDVSDLSVVAYVQDRDKGIILQAAATPHTPGVGIQRDHSIFGPMKLFPNPARDHININFGHQLEHEGQLVMFDIAGRVVMKTDVQSGYTIQRMNISQISKGIYMIYWMESGEVKGHGKFVITP